MIKRILTMSLCVASFLGVSAQQDTAQVVYDTTEEVMYDNDKYKVETNHFWDNWFVSAGFGGEIIFGNQKEGHGEFPTHSTGVDVPGKGGDGYWLMKQKFKFYNLHLDALFNMSNILYGYNEKRVYNCTPYIGLGWVRVWESPQSMEVSANVGILNSFRLNDALNLNLDIRGAYMSDRCHCGADLPVQATRLGTQQDHCPHP